MRDVASTSAATWARSSVSSGRSVRKNQFPPQATSPVTRPMPGTVDLDVPRVAVGGDVLDRDRAVRLEQGAHRADRRVDPDGPGSEAAQVLERARDADEAVAAHAEASGVVEEDDAGRRSRLDRRGQQRPDDRVVPAGLAHDGLSQAILAGEEERPPLRHRRALRLRPAVDHHPGRLALGVRVEHLDPLRPGEAFAHWTAPGYTLSGIAYGARYGRVRSALASASPTIVSVFPSNRSCRPTR